MSCKPYALKLQNYKRETFDSNFYANTFCKEKHCYQIKAFSLVILTVSDSVLASLCNYRGDCTLMVG